jgi:hypothetical protein
MERTGAELVRRGYGIISGNAPGADQAWARGGNFVDPTKVTLCLPWDGFERKTIHPRNVVQLASFDPDRTTRIASMFGSRSTRQAAIWLHARNVMIIEPASTVLGYLPFGQQGGTGMAFKLARMFRVEAENVADEGVRDAIDRLWFDEDLRVHGVAKLKWIGATTASANRRVEVRE